MEIIMEGCFLCRKGSQGHFCPRTDLHLHLFIHTNDTIIGHPTRSTVKTAPGRTYNLSMTDQTRKKSMTLISILFKIWLSL